MSKFAKLFDVEDTQVLFIVTQNENDEDYPALRMTTKIDGLDITQSLGFSKGSPDEMWDKADELLAALNQESAERFYKQMIGMVGADSATERKS